MKVSKNAWSSEEFRKFAERMSKYFNLRGCETEKCINTRIKSKNSKKLNVLVKHGFAFRLLLESWLNPHPVYKKILGMDDETYNMYLDEKREADKRIRAMGLDVKLDRKVKRRFPVFYDDDVIWMKCLECRVVWYPNVNKFESDGEDKDKTLQCEACGYRNRLAPALVKMIKKQPEIEPIWDSEKYRRDN